MVRYLPPKKNMYLNVGYLTKEETEFYLERGYTNAVEIAEEIKEKLLAGETNEEIFEEFKKRFYRGKMVEMYPLQAMILNTHILIDVIKRELTPELL